MRFKKLFLVVFKAVWALSATAFSALGILSGLTVPHAQQELCRAGAAASLVAGTHTEFALHCIVGEPSNPAEESLKWLVDFEERRPAVKKTPGSDFRLTIFSAAVPDDKSFSVKNHGNDKQQSFLRRKWEAVTCGSGQKELPSWEDFATQSLANKRTYCTIHPDVECRFIGAKLEPGRSAHWSKVTGMIEVVENILSRSDSSHFSNWMWEVDVDTVITNHSARMDTILEQHGVDPLTGFVVERPELGQINLVATNECNGFNGGSLLWRVSPSTLLLLRRLHATYRDHVPGLILNWTEVDGITAGRQTPSRSEHLGAPSALEPFLSLLPAGSPTLNSTCQSVVGSPQPSCCAKDMQGLVRLLTETQVSEWYAALSRQEAVTALPRMKRKVDNPAQSVLKAVTARDRALLRIHRKVPLSPLRNSAPAFHEQAALRHLLSTEISASGRNHTYFLPQHKINAYPRSLSRDCPPGFDSGPPFKWEAGRAWKPGDLVAHFPSCRMRTLGEDAFSQWEEVDKEKMKQQVQGNVCGEWMTLWSRWYGRQGLVEDTTEEHVGEAMSITIIKQSSA